MNGIGWLAGTKNQKTENLKPYIIQKVVLGLKITGTVNMVMYGKNT